MNKKVESVFSYAKIISPWKGEIVGEVLKSNKKISFLGDIDPDSGIVVANDSDIKGAKISGKILVIAGGRGSTVGAGVLYGLAKKDLAPKMIIALNPDPVIISGAIFGGIPMVTSVSENFFNSLKSGDLLKCIALNNEKALIKKIGDSIVPH